MAKQQLEQLINAGRVHYTDQLAAQVDAIVERTGQTLLHFSQAADTRTRRAAMAELLGTPLADDTVVNPPFQSDFGAHTRIGRHVFINRDCLFVDLGGITLEDDVLIAPRVSLITVNHVEDPRHRRDLVLQSVKIQRGAWIGAGATVLPGVTVGPHAIVGAGAVVTRDVPADTVVAGVLAKVLRKVRTDGDAQE